MESKYKFKVAARCFTFNHAPYIVDAMNGFAIQDTSFPVVYIVVDDASTDGEPDVIKRWSSDHLIEDNAQIGWGDMPYGQILVAPLKNKPMSLFVILLLSENHYQSGKKNKRIEYISQWLDESKYLSPCEGDDFWTNPNKLQMQVEMMESRPQLSMCFTASIRLSSNGDTIENRMFNNTCMTCSFENYIVSEYDLIDTCTMMYKASLLTVLPDWYRKAGVGDIPSKLVLFSKGDVGYINEVTGCYRLNSAGSWSSRMLRSYKMRKENHKRLLQMWRDFDKWSGKRYHRYIKEKINILRLRSIKSEMVLFWENLKKVFV